MLFNKKIIYFAHLLREVIRIFILSSKSRQN